MTSTRKPSFDRQVIVNDSSNIKALFYDPASAILQVIFASGRRYEYLGVTRTQFGTLVAAESVGMAFNTLKIKDIPNKEIK